MLTPLGISIFFHHVTSRGFDYREYLKNKNDDLVKSQNSMAKEKAPHSRRANPEE